MTKPQKKPLVPALRFPEFQDTGGWKMRSLGEISDRITEKVADRKLTTVSITAGYGFVSQTEKFSRDISGKQYENYILLKKGEFSYNKGNSKKFPQGCVYKLKEFDEVAAPNAFISFKFKNNYVSDFYSGYFDNNAHGKQLTRYITSGARSDGLLNIRPEDFFSIILPTPIEKKEQQKIADCLSSIDDLITAEIQKLAALKEHKKGLMQQLFPAEGETVPKLRFPEFREEWCVKRLKDISVINQGLQIAISQRFTEKVKGSYFYITNEFLKENSSTVYYIKNPPESVICDENDILMTRTGNTGQVVTNVSGAFHNNFFKIRYNDTVNKYFLVYFLTNENTQRTILTLAGGSTIPDLNHGDYYKINISLPSLKEQQKIADCLSSVDELITVQTEKLAALKLHKKGLMQQLFPSMDEGDK